MIISPTQHESQKIITRTMGDLFIRANRLKIEDVTKIITLQDKEGLRFGEAAIQLGLLTDAEVQAMLALQFNYVMALEENTPIAESLDIAHNPFGTEAEEIRRIRSEITMRIGHLSRMVFCVVSPKSGDGKSHVAASLAISFAQLDKKTLLIDANMRAPIQHLLFGINNKTGLSSMLAGRETPSIGVPIPAFSNLHILTAGPCPPNPLEILRELSLADLAEKLANQIDVFIIDTPSAHDYADALVIARQVGIALLVGRQDYTTLSELRRTHREMVTGGVKMLGSVYNGLSPNEYLKRKKNSHSSQKKWWPSWLSRKKSGVEYD
jgi:protein-tyrosine kinase